VILGEKKFLTPEEMGLKAESVDKYLYLFQNDANNFFLKDEFGKKLKGFYVVTRHDFPIRIGQFVLYDVWNNNGDGIGMHIYPNKPSIFYLTSTHSPRDRSEIESKTQMLKDGTKKFYYPVISRIDKTSENDRSWQDFKLVETEYLGFTLFHNGYGILIKYPFS
jgi:hypothetical protein